jgi:glycosyltransferase involved in cell wall biosynthesis
MRTLPRLTPECTPECLDFVLLSFEGPDEYSMAGGLGVRMKELSLELAQQGFPTHLFFVGDPDLAAEESPLPNLTLHRWSQWLSAHHPAGVYAGEEEKLADWNEQLPAFVVSRVVAPAARQGRLTAILAEEWHTAYSTCQLSDRLWAEGYRDRALILWNANNVMGFERIDWGRLAYCAQITTVSRYMKHVMWDRGVNPLVIPNGIPADSIRDPDPDLVTGVRAAFPGRELIFKVGRFSPDKRWIMAIEALAEEKRRGHDIAAVIRGGLEPHGAEVLDRARALGLEVADTRLPRDPAGAVTALAAAPHADVYNVTTFMVEDVISLLYSAADAVLANSGHEPFGLVGLEVMAAGGVVLLGSTGEDYGVSYLNSIMLDTDDPLEICIALDSLRGRTEVVQRLRAEARETARSFTWQNVVTDILLNRLQYIALRQLFMMPPQQSAPTPSGSGEVLAPGTRPAGGSLVAGEAEAPDSERAPRVSGSLAYGGGSAEKPLAVRPRLPTVESPPAGPTGPATTPTKKPRSRKTREDGS